MLHLQTYALFESSGPGSLTPDQKEFLDLYTQGAWSFNPETGLVDVDGSINFKNESQVSLLGISFGRVNGDFNCSENFLESLVGSPKIVSGNYKCGGNNLTSLEGAPEVVGGNFNCVSYHSKITSLKGSPWIVGAKFDCYYSPLTSLVGAPLLVEDLFVCHQFILYGSEWNPVGWKEILSGDNFRSRNLMKTLPYLEPKYWLELYHQDRQKFNDVWVEWRRNAKVRETPLFQEVESALSDRSKSNLDDLEMLGDFM